MTTFRNLAATLVCSVAAIAVTASAFAQAQFRDEKTGKVWTPDNVSKDNQLRPSNEPSTPADKAFDPKAQIATATGVVVQRPNATLMGVVPITAGPTVPIVALDSPTLQASSRRPLGGAALPDQQQRRRRQRADRLHLHQRQQAGAGNPHHRADGGSGSAAGVCRLRAAA